VRIAAFIAGRLAGLVATLLVMSFVVYAALYLAPGSPIDVITGGRPLPPQTIAAINAEYGFDKPFLVRYVQWLGDVIHGDFGQSIVFRQNVSTLLASRAGTTAFLVAYAALLIIAFGIVLGLLSALRKGRADTAILATTTIGIATPSFVAAIVMISVFTLTLHWFPAIGAGSGLTDRIWHLTMPAVALALAGTAYVARLTRAALIETMEQDFVRAARAKGLRRARIVAVHALPSALIPVVTAAGPLVGVLLTGVFVIEDVFQVPGIGRFYVAAVSARDYPLVLGLTIVLAASVIVANLVVDLVHGWLDPRVREHMA
jgi:peptide/nickel transport system permease protein